jgi:hypothetical protein
MGQEQQPPKDGRSADLEPWEPSEEDEERWRSMIREHVPDKDRLAELEGVIEQSKEAMVEACLALKSIHDEGLFRQSHGTFEAYCRERWGFTRQRGYQLLSLARAMTTAVDTPPRNEWQHRQEQAGRRKRAEPPKVLPPAPSQPENRPSSSGPNIGVHAEGGSQTDTYVESPAAPSAAPSKALIECPACHHRFDPEGERP